MADSYTEGIDEDGRRVKSQQQQEHEHVVKVAEFYLPVFMNVLDIILCVISYFTSFSQVQCCGQEDALYNIAQVILTSIFVLVVAIELVLLFRKKGSSFLRAVNPLFGFAITILTAYSASYTEAMITLGLTVIEALLSLWLVCRVWLEFREIDSPSPADRLKFYFSALMVSICLVGCPFVIFFLVRIVEAGGVCIWRISDRFFQVTSQPEYCFVCPNGLPADPDLEFFDLINEGYASDLKSKCTGRELYGTYCGLNSTNENVNKKDFCFLEYSWKEATDKFFGKHSPDLSTCNASLISFTGLHHCVPNGDGGCGSCGSFDYPQVQLIDGKCSACCWDDETNTTTCDEGFCNEKVFCNQEINVEIISIKSINSIFAGSGTVRFLGSGSKSASFVEGSSYDIVCQGQDCDDVYLAGTGTFECEQSCANVKVYDTFTGKIKCQQSDCNISYFSPNALPLCGNSFDTSSGPCCGESMGDCDHLGLIPN